MGITVAGTVTIKLFIKAPEKLSPWTHVVTIIILIFSSASSLGIFATSQLYRCVFSSGRENCLFEGLASLSLGILSLTIAIQTLLEHKPDRMDTYINRLLLVGIWAGISYTENVLLILPFLYLFYYLVNRWLKGKGLQWRFLVAKDDYHSEK